MTLKSAASAADDQSMRVFLAAAAAALTVAAGGATAAASAYPPATNSVTATPTSGAPGYDVTVTAHCGPFETVTVELSEATAQAKCRLADEDELVDGDLGGRATATIDAPSTPGAYRGVAMGTSSGDLGGFVISVDDVVSTGQSASPLADSLGVDWSQVFRYSSIGSMVVAFFAVLLFLRRRHEYT